MRIAGIVGSGLVFASVAAATLTPRARAANVDPQLLAFADKTGVVATLNVNGAFDLDNPFFKDIGTNGRRCVTCHQPATGWTITPDLVRARFDATGGSDPLFRTNDGSDCAGIGSVNGNQASAYSLLLSRGVIRVAIDVPAGAEFDVLAVDDPHTCGTPLQTVSVYRRPLPSANLRFISAVMWDGRESSSTTDIPQDLAQQANDATRGHAQADRDLTDEERRQIVGFETGLFTAQSVDRDAGSLSGAGATGGPVWLSQQPFFLGINDPVGLNPTGASFDPAVFKAFDAWSALAGPGKNPFTEARRAIARGQQIFNTRSLTIAGVAGLNGATFGTTRVPDSFTGTCTVCHDTPNAGSHSVKAPLDIGIADVSRRAADVPLYTLVNRTTGQTVQTTDPGRALITGKWNDIAKFKGPVLRGLAARAPYFHDGSVATLADVVDFYDQRLDIRLTAQEKADLLAFLQSL